MKWFGHQDTSTSEDTPRVNPEHAGGLHIPTGNTLGSLGETGGCGRETAVWAALLSLLPSLKVAGVQLGMQPPTDGSIDPNLDCWNCRSFNGPCVAAVADSFTLLQLQVDVR